MIPLQVIETCESTNTYILENWDIQKESSFAVLALDQTHGRGRGENSWSFYPGNLAMSIGLLLEKEETPSLYPFLLAVSVARSLEVFLKKEDLLLKWPNDIFFQRKKMGGILSQARQTASSTILVLGLGLNLQKAPILSNVRYQAIALLDAGVSLDAISLGQEILHSFTHGLMEKEQGLREWESYAQLPQDISISNQAGVFSAHGLTKDGGLKVCLKDGEGEKVLYSEEINLL